MSTKLSSATALNEVRVASASGALGVSQGGPQAELGAKVTANAETGSDRVLYHVYGFNAAAPNVAKRGEAIAASGPLYQATTSLVPGESDVAVTVPEASGDQTWVYVQAAAASTILRGSVCFLSTAGTYVVSQLAAPGAMPSRVAGVAQHKIPALSFGWILVKGHGVANAAVASVVAAGTELTSIGGAAGELVALTSGAKGIGLSLAAGTIFVAGASDASAVNLDI